MTITRRQLIAAPAAFGVYWSMGNQAQNTSNPSELDPVNDLVAANHVLTDQGIVDGYGHVSIRDPKNPNQYLMARDLPPALVTASDILTYGLDSNPLNAKGIAVVSERFIHGEIYKARPEVTAVVHAHTAELIVFTVMDIPLRPISHMSAFVGAGVPVFEIRTAREPADKSMLIHTPALGQALARSLGPHPAALIRGHGGVIVGSSVGQAVARSVYLKENATVQREAMLIGGKINYLDADEARENGDNTYYRDWEAWRRTANRGCAV
jgi:ribulose-5-phosphate 4-epimerase/fuculose-1-phosphate aldolase